MLKNLFRLIVIARTASAAQELVRNMSAHQLQDVGIDPNTHVQQTIAGMKAEFKAQDEEAKVLKASNVRMSIKLQSA
jgi:hypothetical protein